MGKVDYPTAIIINNRLNPYLWLMKFIAIIPARFDSTRFPGKPLAKLHNKPMIQWVVENVMKCVEDVWVATDSDKIMNAVAKFGGRAVKTRSTHQSGTDRCAEAAEILSKNHDFDVVINVQGDEPFISPEQIELLQSCFTEETKIATLIKRIDNPEDLFNPNRPKVVIDNERNALYFSRSTIPFVRGETEKNWLSVNTFWAHVGMYAYHKQVLQEITKLKHGKLELTESLEQLRWLANGYKIKTAETNHQSIGIDTPEDLDYAVQLLGKNESQ